MSGKRGSVEGVFSRVSGAREGCMAWLLGVVGCAGAAAAPDEVVLSPSAAASSAASATTAPEAHISFERALEVDLCAERKPCKIVKTTPATSDPAVLVVLVKLGVERYFNDEAAVDETFTSESGTDRFAASYGGCARFEYWRVTRAGASVAERRLLAAVCNDGHGAAQVGEEAVFFDGERFQRDKSGGSAWRWAYTKSYSIAPLAPLVDESVGFWTLQENQGKTDWDYRSFSGSYEWTAPRCDASGAAGPGVDTFSGPLVPDVVVDPAFADGGWRTSRLGACSLSLDDGASATLRAVASRGKVFVEVVDDVVTSVTAPVGDELTLSFSPSAPSYYDHCAPADRVEALAVRAADGKSKGSASASVEVVPATAPGEPLRAVFTVPKDTEAITLTYRDSDDGKRHAGRIESSALSSKDAATLGRTFQVSLGHARCDLVDGRLAPRVEVTAPTGIDLTEAN